MVETNHSMNTDNPTHLHKTLDHIIASLLLLLGYYYNGEFFLMETQSILLNVNIHQHINIIILLIYCSKYKFCYSVVADLVYSLPSNIVCINHLSQKSIIIITCILNEFIVPDNVQMLGG